MTKICLPNMLKRGKGVIINVSSASALQPTPLLTVYSATKVSGATCECNDTLLKASFALTGLR